MAKTVVFSASDTSDSEEYYSLPSSPTPGVDEASSQFFSATRSFPEFDIINDTIQDGSNSQQDVRDVLSMIAERSKLRSASGDNAMLSLSPNASDSEDEDNPSILIRHCWNAFAVGLDSIAQSTFSVDGEPTSHSVAASETCRSLFGSNLSSLTSHSHITTFKNLFRHLRVQKIVKISRKEDVDVFRVFHKSRGAFSNMTTIIKVVDSTYIVRNEDILGKMMDISSKLQNIRSNASLFVKLYDLYTIFDKYESSMFDENTSFLEKEIVQPFVVIHSEDGGEDLASLILNMSPLQHWNIIQQLCLGLSVAEHELEFEHRHLTLDHIFIKQCTTCCHDVFEYLVDEKRYLIKCDGVSVRVGNIIRSRLNLQGEIVCNDLTDWFLSFERSSDEYWALSTVKKKLWSASFPSTTVRYIIILIDAMIEMTSSSGDISGQKLIALREKLKKHSRITDAIIDVI